MWVQGKLVKIVPTSRPETIWPEQWNVMSKKQRKEAAKKAEKEMEFDSI